MIVLNYKPIIYIMDCYIEFKKLQTDAIIPVRATEDSAGFDLFALEETVITGGCGNVLVPTGIAVNLPRSSYGRIAMRSGLAKNQHLGVSAGVIDYDYTGPIGVLVFASKIFATDAGNPFAVPRPFSYTIRKGERFAQLVIERISMSPGREIDYNSQLAFTATHIGFGSTGTGVNDSIKNIERRTDILHDSIKNTDTNSILANTASNTLAASNTSANTNANTIGNAGGTSTA